MSSKDKDSVDIGFDPLAWMSDSNEQSDEVSEQGPVEAAAADEPQVEATPEITEEAVQTEPEEISAAAPEITETTEVVDTASDSYRVELAGKVDIASAAELKKELTDALNQGGSITFAAADVARADGAGLQLISAFVKELDNNHRDLVWEEPSEQLIDAANILGLKEILHLA